MSNTTVPCPKFNWNRAEHDLVPYFAIGSMINPVSLSLRGITPTKSLPGLCKGFELVFRGSGGMADVEQKDGAEFHGVIHYITWSEMDQLDAIEGWYDSLLVDITLYDGSLVPAKMYQMDKSKRIPGMPDNPPGERYIDIIVRGCKHYGVKQEYIEWLQSVNCVPRRKPNEYRKLPIPAEIRYFTLEEIKASNGDNGAPLRFAINGKVLEFIADEPSMSNPTVRQWHDMAKKRFAGSDQTLQIAKNLYEPIYDIPTTRENMTADHCAYTEDMICGFMSAQQQNSSNNSKAVTTVANATITAAPVNGSATNGTSHGTTNGTADSNGHSNGTTNGTNDTNGTTHDSNGSACNGCKSNGSNGTDSAACSNSSCSSGSCSASADTCCKPSVPDESPEPPAADPTRAALSNVWFVVGMLKQD